MEIPEHVLELVKQRSNLKLTQPSDCDALALEIENVTGNHLGVNTLKRLFGILEANCEPRISTLNILANYLGAESWEELLKSISCDHSKFGLLEGEILSDNLTPLTILDVEYSPNYKLVLEYQGKDLYKVVMEKNTKLVCMDVLEISALVPGLPLYVKNVMRNGVALGRFSDALKTGIKSIKVVQ